MPSSADPAVTLSSTGVGLHRQQGRLRAQLAVSLVLGMALAFNGASLFTVAASCCAVVLIAEWILL